MQKGAKRAGIAAEEAWSKAKHPSGAACGIQGLTNTPSPARRVCRPALEGIPDPSPSSSGAPWLQVWMSGAGWALAKPQSWCKERGELSQPLAELGFEAG